MKSNRLFLAIILGLAIFGLAVGTAYYYWQFQGNRSTLEIVDQVTPVPTKEKKSVPEGMMVLIEYKDLVGLSNFVNELYQRQIPSVLLATPEFVEENCQAIKKMTNLGMEIIGYHTEAPFWDIPYEEQYQRISEIKEGIETEGLTNWLYRSTISPIFIRTIPTSRISSFLKSRPVVSTSKATTVPIERESYSLRLIVMLP